MPTKLPHITDDHHFAIANVAGRAAQMEVHIEKTIAIALEDTPATAKFLLLNLGTDRIVGLLKALLLDRLPEETASIERIIKAITDLRSDRNGILHWTWIPGLEPGTSIASTARPFREFRYKNWSPDEVQDIADQIQRVSHALMEWQGVLRKLPEPA